MAQEFTYKSGGALGQIVVPWCGLGGFAPGVQQIDLDKLQFGGYSAAQAQAQAGMTTANAFKIGTLNTSALAAAMIATKQEYHG